MKKFAPGFLLVTLLSVTALAQNAQVQTQDRDALPNNYLAGKQVKYSHPTPGGPYAAQKHAMIAASTLSNTTTTTSTFPPGVDTLVNFVGNYRVHGINYNGKSNDQWQYSMVGNPPGRNQTTVINAPVIPVTIDMLNADGSPRSVITNSHNCPKCTPSELGQTVRLRSSPGPFTNRFLQSPVFGMSTYTSSYT